VLGTNDVTPLSPGGVCPLPSQISHIGGWGCARKTPATSDFYSLSPTWPFFECERACQIKIKTRGLSRWQNNENAAISSRAWLRRHAMLITCAALSSWVRKFVFAKRVFSLINLVFALLAEQKCSNIPQYFVIAWFDAQLVKKSVAYGIFYGSNQIPHQTKLFIFTT